MATDGRGSKLQRLIYDLLLEIYPKYTVVYEQAIHAISMRYDLFVKELGIAVEIDGIQHRKYVEHFHGDFHGRVSGILADKKKNEFSVENGIKLIRIPDDDKVWDAIRLKKLIDSVPYPTATYCSNLLDGRPPSEERRLQKDREKRQEQYRRNKERRKLMDEKKEN